MGGLPRQKPLALAAIPTFVWITRDRRGVNAEDEVDMVRVWTAEPTGKIHGDWIEWEVDHMNSDEYEEIVLDPELVVALFDLPKGTKFSSLKCVELKLEVRFV